MESRTPVLLSLRRVAEIIGLSESALRNHILRGTGPPARKLSPRRIVVHQDDLWAWIDGLRRVNSPRLRAEPPPLLEIDLGENGE